MYRYISKLITLFYFLFFSVNIQSQTWRQFTKADGLTSNRFLTMIGDQQDNLWVGMPRYISRINGGSSMKPSKSLKANMGVQRFMAALLIMIVFVGCGKDKSGKPKDAG